MNKLSILIAAILSVTATDSFAVDATATIHFKGQIASLCKLDIGEHGGTGANESDAIFFDEVPNANKSGIKFAVLKTNMLQGKTGSLSLTFDNTLSKANAGSLKLKATDVDLYYGEYDFSAHKPKSLLPYSAAISSNGGAIKQYGFAVNYKNAANANSSQEVQIAYNATLTCS